MSPACGYHTAIQHYVVILCHTSIHFAAHRSADITLSYFPVL